MFKIINWCQHASALTLEYHPDAICYTRENEMIQFPRPLQVVSCDTIDMAERRDENREEVSLWENRVLGETEVSWRFSLFNSVEIQFWSSDRLSLPCI